MLPFLAATTSTVRHSRKLTGSGCFVRQFSASKQATQGKVHQAVNIPGVKHVIPVASGKGGVGKSTTAANLAVAMSQLDKKVALLDADVYGPSLPILMNLKGKRPRVNERKFLMPLMSYGIKCMSMGFLVEEESAMIWRGPMVMGALEQLLRQVEWGDVDVMIVDMPPGTGDAQLSLSQTVRLTGAIIVCTPQDMALADVIRGVQMFRKVNVPILGIVENMSYYVCPKCNDTAHIFGKDGARKMAEKLNVPLLGEIPLVPDIRSLSDKGTPITLAQPDGVYAETFKGIARNILQMIERTEFKESQKPPEFVVE